MKNFILYLLFILPCTALGQNADNVLEEMTPGMIHAIGSVMKTLQQEGDNPFIVVKGDTIRKEVAPDAFLTAVVHQAIVKNTVTEIAGIPFGSSYDATATSLFKKFGKASYSDHSAILYKHIFYGGESFSDVVFSFQSDGKNNFFCGALFAVEVRNIDDALNVKERFHHRLAERYPSTILLGDSLSAGGLPPVPYRRAVPFSKMREGQNCSDFGFGFEINVMPQDKYEYPYFVRIKYGPYEYVKEDF